MCLCPLPTCKLLTAGIVGMLNVNLIVQQATQKEKIVNNQSQNKAMMLRQSTVKHQLYAVTQF